MTEKLAMLEEEICSLDGCWLNINQQKLKDSSR